MTQLEKLSHGQEFLWINPDHGAERSFSLTQADIDDADARLRRFAPLIETCCPETAVSHGIIESPLRGIPDMMHHCFPDVPGNLYLKMDSDLPIAGSVKARGGIYEVLVHTEELALEHGLLSGTDDDYRKLCTPEARSFFSGYSMQVGSTGNLGMSIGIMSAAIGYNAIVHMSADTAGNIDEKGMAFIHRDPGLFQLGRETVRRDGIPHKQLLGVFVVYKVAGRIGIGTLPAVDHRFSVVPVILDHGDTVLAEFVLFPLLGIR